ncbi:MAG: 50S ribosomal protein L29 [Candidatus Buchananbacteria bacterium RIFCSPHIGHO2_02_FULL_38_8]|uniref:Large ribosomal subunit protein uL29 n=2 Tax=Candidatus Buchananiibacteriota TaxID=1817903 RepID=A0A1G1XZT4_9BACT|nr:MAG: 50S ribosomal protein L29 [Candidatus Buchananbacteria bacterium RIFCSPHIGHO2_01_FULL_39_8]OGY47541.1 MAG: 50S ribosomal protein L29 [Candidatus Buchananbacteria bacterium RIFCSPHIGHO2_02_FULL_38_8]
MKFKELKSKPEAELNKVLNELRDKLRELRFKVTSKQLKNLRDVRETKKTIARILTLLKQKTQELKIRNNSANDQK